MKVINKSFAPITIVIETEQEAKILWHLLNMNAVQSKESYCKSNQLSDDFLNSSKVDDMWKTFNIAYGGK